MNGQFTAFSVSTVRGLMSCPHEIPTGHLVEIDTDSMILCVAVEEHAKLKERIGTVFDAGNHTARRECGLFNVSVEILRVPVKNEFAKFVQLNKSKQSSQARGSWLLTRRRGGRTGNLSLGHTLVTSKGSKPNCSASACSGCIICTCAVHEIRWPASIAAQRSRLE